MAYSTSTNRRAFFLVLEQVARQISVQTDEVFMTRNLFEVEGEPLLFYTCAQFSFYVSEICFTHPADC